MPLFSLFCAARSASYHLVEIWGSMPTVIAARGLHTSRHDVDHGLRSESVKLKTGFELGNSPFGNQLSHQCHATNPLEIDDLEQFTCSPVTRNSLAAKEKRLDALNCGEPFLYQIGTTGFEPATSCTPIGRSRSPKTQKRLERRLFGRLNAVHCTRV